jgi:hypothetical protein
VSLGGIFDGLPTLSSLRIREDGADGSHELLSVVAAAATRIIATDEVVSLECTAGDPYIEVTPASLRISVSSGGSVVIRGGEGDSRAISVRGIPDTVQLHSRMTNVSCRLDSSLDTRESMTYFFDVHVRGVAQPSMSVMCQLDGGMNTSAVDATAPINDMHGCSGTQLTTNGAAQIVIVGCDDPLVRFRRLQRIQQ